MSAQNGSSPKILVLDERANALRKDWGNIDHPEPEVMRAVAENVEVFIRITQDGVWVDRGVGKVMLHRVKSEAEESLEHAEKHKALRLGEEPRSEHNRVASLDKAFTALGTDDKKRVEIMRGAHLADDQ